MKTLALFSGMVLGALCPWAGQFSWLIRYFLIFTMFVSMLQVRASRTNLRPSLLWIFGATLAIGIGSWALLLALGQKDLAQAAFFTGISPTAAAAAVVVGLLGGSAGYTVNSFLLTNFGVALLMPVLIPMITGNAADGVMEKVAKDILIVVGIPAAGAFLCRKMWAGYRTVLPKLKLTAFYCWAVMIFLIIANASAFIRKSRVSWVILGEIALLTFAICALNFWLGGLLEKKYRKREASQCLGQKNTSFTIFLALTYGCPLSVLGPTFYVVWHNTWNGMQIRLYEKRLRRRAERKKSLCKE